MKTVDEQLRAAARDARGIFPPDGERTSRIVAWKDACGTPLSVTSGTATVISRTSTMTLMVPGRPGPARQDYSCAPTCPLSQSQNVALAEKNSLTFSSGAGVDSQGSGFQCCHVVSPLCLSKSIRG